MGYLNNGELERLIANFSWARIWARIQAFGHPVLGLDGTL